MTGFGLYVHIPYCETKCGYCDFYSVPLRDRAVSPLVDAVVAELRSRTSDLVHPIRTIFVGGGTPTVLPASDLKTLMAALADVVREHPIDEFTVEANPGTVTDEKTAMLAAAGVDRVSMGAQSWHVDELASLERLHSPDDIGPGVATLRRHGIGRVNLDLIFGIPGQTVSTWTESLDLTVGLNVDHICCYGLTYEPGTRLTAQRRVGTVIPCEEDIEVQMYRHATSALRGYGFEQYEISNFAKPNQRCTHNMTYWRNEPYIGIGPSAAGYVDGERYKNVPDAARYVSMMNEAGNAVVEREQVSGVVLAGETIMMQLRLNDGIDLGDFRARTGVDLAGTLGRVLDRFAGDGLLRVCESSVSLTDDGRLVSDAIIGELFSGLPQASL
jgi:oxygen-independent coproporphyrinogen III oxidase